MSYPAMAWARTIKTGSATNKSVLLAVANYANEDGVCWPSQERLAEDTELSRRSIVRALDDLEAAGHITRERRHRSDGSRKTDLITLRLCDTKAPSKNTQSDTAPIQGDTVSKPKCHNVTAEPFIEPTIEPSSISSDDEFEEFWAAYPKRPNNPKAPAAAKYVNARQRLQVSHETIVNAAKAYAATRKGEDPKYTAQAVTWLNQRRWEEYSEPTAVQADLGDVDLTELVKLYPGHVGTYSEVQAAVKAQLRAGAALDHICEAAKKYAQYLKELRYEGREIAPPMIETWLKFKWREMDAYEFARVGPDRRLTVRPKRKV